MRSEKIKLFFAPNLPLPELIGATRGFGLLVNSPALLLHPGLQRLQPGVLENKFLNNVFVVGKQFLEILVSDPICKTYAGVNWLKDFQLSQSFKNFKLTWTNIDFAAAVGERFAFSRPGPHDDGGDHWQCCTLGAVSRGRLCL